MWPVCEIRGGWLGNRGVSAAGVGHHLRQEAAWSDPGLLHLPVQQPLRGLDELDVNVRLLQRMLRADTEGREELAVREEERIEGLRPARAAEKGLEDLGVQLCPVSSVWG